MRTVGSGKRARDLRLMSGQATWGLGEIFFFTTVLKYRGRGLTNKGRQRGRRHVSRKEQYFCPDSKQLPNKPQK